jgi:aspartokinase-like uncharacterized kinase
MNIESPPPGLVVVKVGGSLYDHPRLGPGLRAYLDQLDASKILVVAGGGIVADAVRQLDEWQELGEEVSHHLALQAANVGMHFLLNCLGFTPGCWTTRFEWWKMVDKANCLGAAVFLMQYEEAFGALPHTWDLTTDSIAALAAGVARARLILLKSIDIPPDTRWLEASRRGWVDACFPSIVDQYGLEVQSVNFRRWLDYGPS